MVGSGCRLSGSVWMEAQVVESQADPRATRRPTELGCPYALTGGDQTGLSYSLRWRDISLRAAITGSDRRGVTLPSKSGTATGSGIARLSPGVFSFNHGPGFDSMLLHRTANCTETPSCTCPKHPHLHGRYYLHTAPRTTGPPQLAPSNSTPALPPPPASRPATLYRLLPTIPCAHNLRYSP